MKRDNVIYLDRRFAMSQKQAERLALEQFVSREEYPELFGDETKFEFEVEDESERCLMPLEEFNDKLEKYRERIAQEKGVTIEKDTVAFEITEE